MEQNILFKVKANTDKFKSITKGNTYEVMSIVRRYGEIMFEIRMDNYNRPNQFRACNFDWNI